MWCSVTGAPPEELALGVEHGAAGERGAADRSPHAALRWWLPRAAELAV